MTKPPAMSLRIRSAEAKHRARKFLQRLDEGESVRRRIRWQAAKARASISEILGELEKLSAGERARWEAQCRSVQTFLKRLCGDVMDENLREQLQAAFAEDDRLRRELKIDEE
jgi:hypothetical protein